MAEKHNLNIAHHHTAICCENWDRTVPFYLALGYVMENDWYWPDGVKNHKSLMSFNHLDDCWLELFEYPGSEGVLNERYTESAGCVFEFALRCESAQAVDGAYSIAVNAPLGKAVGAPRDYEFKGEKRVWKFRKATVAGPDGEHITFIFDYDGKEERAQVNGIVGFHHNALRVSDLKRAVDFYDGMGFELDDIYPLDDGTSIALLRLPNGNGILLRDGGKKDLPTDMERMRAAGSMFQYCFKIQSAEDIDTIYNHSIAIGGRERIKPFWHEAYGLASWVDRPAFTYGPDDEILEFLYIDYDNGKKQK